MIAAAVDALAPVCVLGHEAFAYGLATSLCRAPRRALFAWGADVLQYAAMTDVAGAMVRNESIGGPSNKRGTVAMARTSDPHSATAQFFVNVKDNLFLDAGPRHPGGFGYTVFGHVVEGMDVADKMVATPTGAAGPFDQDAPKTPIVLTKATIIAR